ncbi:MAG: hypothetical protein ACR2MY_14800 [Candidatus Dormibacteria bacterium]
MLFGFAASAYAMTQGEFQPATRRGLVSLALALAVLAVLLVSGWQLDHLHLPPGT